MVRNDGEDGVGLRFEQIASGVAARLESLVASLPSVESLHGGEADALGIELGNHSPGDLIGREDLDVQPEAALKDDVRLELSDVLVRVREDKIAALEKLDVRTELVLEPAEEPYALDGEPGVLLRAPLLADAPAASPRRAACQVARLDHNRVGDPLAREVVGDRGPHDTATDDDTLSGSLHRPHLP